MKSHVACALFAALPVQWLRTASAEVSTPVGRVVGLLQGLRTKLEADMKAEESIFEEYVCWYKAIVNSKTASNSAAESRIESLNTYVQDIDAGRITFTTEQQDLEKQVEALRKDLETAKALRESENADYTAAVEEMTRAIAALTGAIETIEGAEPPAASSMLALRAYRSRQHLQQALLLGRSMLDKTEVRYLEGVIAGEVPKPDWKKLNRKATFKSKYESRTGEISKTLRGLNDTFAANLEEAHQKEEKAQATYDELSKAKGDMLKKAEQALVDLVEENGARGLSKQEALAEVAALTEQVTADKKFIEDAETAHTQKNKEWTARLKLRQMELKAMSDAIAVLHSDEARDTFTKSYSLVQLQAVRAGGAVVDRLLQKAAAAASGTRGAAALQAAASSGTRSIEAVITHIDRFLTELADEENSDLKTKEDCESERASLTRKAKVASVAIDGLTEDIDRAKAKAEEIAGQIKEQQATIGELNGTIQDLTRQREDEKKQYESDKVDDQQAVALIEKAMKIFEKLKTDMAAAGGAALIKTGVKVHGGSSAAGRAISVHAAAAASAGAAKVNAASHVSVAAHGKQAAPYEIKAGEAPPPPPATWEDPSYGGAEGEQTGIHSILALIKEDIESDISKADSDEQEAVAYYEKEKGELESAIKAAEAAISQYEGEQSVEEQTVVDKTGERSTEMDALAGTMKQIEALKPGCDFFLVNYSIRAKKRQIEMDGLRKAKAILQGGKFD